MNETTENRSLREWVIHFYTEAGYNCSETLIHAGNAYYHLGLHEEDMKMMACFGGGMYSGITCGALISSTAVLSKCLTGEKAHDNLMEIRPVIQSNVRRFKELLGGTDCAKVKPLHYSKEEKCLQTVLLGAQALEETMKEYHLNETGT